MKILSLSLLLLLAATVSQGRPSVPKLIELLTSTNITENDPINYFNCRSWHLGVETANIINFETVPENCKDYVEEYICSQPDDSDQYCADSKTVCKEAYYYAKVLPLKNDTVNIWIFDLDETLLSNVPFYAQYGYGTEKHDPDAFKKWLEAGEAPVLPQTLHLYKKILELGIEPVLLTERYQDLKEVTLKNLEAAGYTYWRQVLFKPTGLNTKIATFKSNERKKLVRSGHTIIGNIGDLWADLAKDSPGRRTFKLPNPLYYKH